MLSPACGKRYLKCVIQNIGCIMLNLESIYIYNLEYTYFIQVHTSQTHIPNFTFRIQLSKLHISHTWFHMSSFRIRHFTILIHCSEFQITASAFPFTHFKYHVPYPLFRILHFCFQYRIPLSSLPTPDFKFRVSKFRIFKFQIPYPASYILNSSFGIQHCEFYISSTIIEITLRIYNHGSYIPNSTPCISYSESHKLNFTLRILHITTRIPHSEWYTSVLWFQIQYESHIPIHTFLIPPSKNWTSHSRFHISGAIFQISYPGLYISFWIFHITHSGHFGIRIQHFTFQNSYTGFHKPDPKLRIPHYTFHLSDSTLWISSTESRIPQSIILLSRLVLHTPSPIFWISHTQSQFLIPYSISLITLSEL